MPRSFPGIDQNSGDFYGLSNLQNDSPPTDQNQYLRRLASLIAVGDAPMPTDLEPSEESLVLAEVAQLRRDRLIQFLALAIARDIHQGPECYLRSIREC